MAVLRGTSLYQQTTQGAGQPTRVYGLLTGAPSEDNTTYVQQTTTSHDHRTFNPMQGVSDTLDATVWQARGWAVLPTDMAAPDARGRVRIAAQQVRIRQRMSQTKTNSLASDGTMYRTGSLWRWNPTTDARTVIVSWNLTGTVTPANASLVEVSTDYNLAIDVPEVIFESGEVLLIQLGGRVNAPSAIGGNTARYRLHLGAGTRIEFVSGGLHVHFTQDAGDTAVAVRGAELSKVVKLVRPIEPTVLVASSDRRLEGYRNATTATDHAATVDRVLEAVRGLETGTDLDAVLDRDLDAFRELATVVESAGTVGRWVELFRHRSAASALLATADRALEGYRDLATVLRLTASLDRLQEAFREFQTTVRVATGEISKIIKRTYTAGVGLASELAKLVLRDQAAGTALSATATVLLTKVMATASRLAGSVRRVYIGVRRITAGTRAVGSARIEAPISVWERSVGDGTTVVKRTTYIFDD